MACKGVVAVAAAAQEAVLVWDLGWVGVVETKVAWVKRRVHW